MIGSIMKRIFLLTAFSLLLFSCSSKNDVQVALANDESVSIYDINYIKFEPRGSEVTLTFTAASEWNVRTSNNAFKIASSSNGDEGTHNVVVRTSVNRSGDTQTGRLIFSCGQIERTIAMEQPAPYLNVRILDAAKLPRELNEVVMLWNESKENKTEPYVVEIKSNIDWKIDFHNDSHDAFALPLFKGFGDANIPVNVALNNIDKVPYEAEFQIAGYMDNTCEVEIGEGITTYEKVIFHQNNLRFLLNDGCEDMSVAVSALNDTVSVNGNKSVTSITIDSEMPWNIQAIDGADWVNVDRTSGDSGVCEIFINAAPTGSQLCPGVNPYDRERTAKLEITSDGGAKRYVDVVQSAFIFKPSMTEVLFPNNTKEDALSRILTFDSSGPWTIDSGNLPEWLHLSVTEGEKGLNNVQLICSKQNLKLEKEECKIKFKSAFNDLVRDVNISQDKFELGLNFASGSNVIPATSDDKIQFELNVVSSGKWALSSKETWLKLSTSQGEGNTTVKFWSDSINPDMSKDRTANVELVSLTHQEKSWPEAVSFSRDITQEKFIFDISIADGPAPAYTKSSKTKLYIHCSGEWELKDCADWIVPEMTSGGPMDGYIWISPKTNTSPQKRTGYVRILSKFNNQSKYVSLQQEGFIFNVSQSSFSSLPPVNAPSQTLLLTCPSEAGWTLSSNSGGWVASLSGSTGTGEKNISFQIADNPYLKSRETLVTISSTVEGVAPLTVKFKQNQYEFVVNPAGSSYDFKTLPSNVYNTISVLSSAGWVIYTTSDWLRFSSKSGSSSERTFTVSAANNVNTADRNAEFYVRAPENMYNQNKSLEQRFAVHQAGYVWDVSGITGMTFYYDNDLKSQVATIDIKCSGNWNVSSTGDKFLSIDATSGSGDARITLIPSTNSSLNDRHSTVTVTSLDNPVLSKTFEYSQKGFVFNVSPVEQTFDNKENNGEIKISCSSTCKAVASDDWIKLDISTIQSGDNVSLKYKVAKNETKSDRQGTIVITSDQFEKTQTVRVTQQK